MVFIDLEWSVGLFIVILLFEKSLLVIGVLNDLLYCNLMVCFGFMIYILVRWGESLLLMLFILL